MEKPTIKFTTDIILIDVVGYSSLPNEYQLFTVEAINECISKSLAFWSALKFLKREDVLLGFIPTGDGVYIILNPTVCGYGIFLGLSLRNHLLYISSGMRELYKGIRVGINMGDVLPVNDINGNRNYVGDGLNDCARLLSVKEEDAITFYGDSNYVVASESAYYWFSKLYIGDEVSEFLSTIKFKRSDKIVIVDKHKKVHNAYMVESTRYIAIQPPYLKTYETNPGTEQDATANPQQRDF
ncbi:MAG: hypothetical protein ABR577_04860 [Pyrinomonadaceae bacterium]